MRFKFRVFFLVLLSSFLFSMAGNAQDTLFSASDSAIVQALEKLNTYRTNAGLPPVKLNENLSRACFAHARYVVKNRNHPGTRGLAGHYENDTLPFATPEGKKAGLNSCIAYVNACSAIEQFMNTFYHRLPLLDPRTTEVGIGYYRENYYTVCCVDMRSGIQWNLDTAHVVVYPENEALDIPLWFQRELPDPLPEEVTVAGFPVTVQFFGHYGLKAVQVQLTDKAGKVVPCILSTPDEPLTSFPQYNTVCIIPTKGLQYNQTYTVHFACTIDGKPFRKSWIFYTRIGWAK